MNSPELDLEGELAPPLANGELVFDAPWQGRVFGMARSLCIAGLYSWDDFRAHLISAIAHWEREQQNASEPYNYYALFLQAFEAILKERNLLQTDELLQAINKLKERPHGHDH